MRLLGKIVLGLLILHGVVVGLIVAQRLATRPHLRDLLAIDEACGDNCWYGIALDGSFNRSMASDAITAQRQAQLLSIRGPGLRFSIQNADSGSAINSVQVTLDNGVATGTCAFTSSVVLGEVYAAFGEPDYFVLDLWTQRYFWQRNEIRINYQLHYTEENMVFGGFIEWDIDDTRPRLPIDTRILQMCTPISAIQAESENMASIQWQGFYNPLRFDQSNQPFYP